MKYTYTNFDIETLDYKEEGGVETFKVRVQDIQRTVDAETITLNPEIRNQLVNLVNREFKGADLVQYGKWLGEALLPPKVRNKFRSKLRGLGKDERLRIRLKLETYALAELPWEYIYLPDDDSPDTGEFIVLNQRVSITHFEIFDPTVKSPGPVTETPLRFVAIFANPKGTDELNLPKEKQNIEAYLSALGDKIDKKFVEHATAIKLQDALRKGAHVFHFSGHGEFRGKRGEKYGERLGEGVLLLENEDGTRRELTADRLKLALQGTNMRLVVLGACKGGMRDAKNEWSGVVPALVQVGIPAVLGMQFTIGDDNAIAFSRGFYAALAAGLPIDAAVSEGRKSVRLATDDDERDWGTPVLYLRGDEDDVRLFPESTSQSQAPADETRKPSPPAATPPVSTTPVDSRTLREYLINHFSEADLEILCADLSDTLQGAQLLEPNETVTLEVVGGDSKPAKVLNLIQYLQRRGWYVYLLLQVRQTKQAKSNPI